jgi:hypothetical protein
MVGISQTSNWYIASRAGSVRLALLGVSFIGHHRGPGAESAKEIRRRRL